MSSGMSDLPPPPPPSGPHGSGDSVGPPGTPRSPGSDVARAYVKPPAIAMMITAGLALLGNSISIVMQVVTDPKETAAELRRTVDQFPAEWRDLFNSVADFQEQGGKELTIAALVFALLVSAFILFGGTRMYGLRSYGLAVATSVCIMIPCPVGLGSCCCCLGLPLGIWSLVVLMKPEVKAAFR